MENLGQRVLVTLRLKKFGIPPHTIELRVTMRNVTEIHYNYPRTHVENSLSTMYDRVAKAKALGLERRIAFESDVHLTGQTYAVSEVVEFEATAETEKAEHF